MIAYNSAGLDNRQVRTEAAEAEEENIISAEEHSNLRSAFPDPFYTPPFFARLGLFLLTCICLCFCSGFFAFVTVMTGDDKYYYQAFLMAIVVFFALEWLIRNKKHLASGVDDALLYTAAGLLTGGVYLVAPNISPVGQSLLFLVVATGCTVRYADRLTALIAFAALLALLFFTGLKTGPIAKALMPFLLMAFCTAIYFSVIAYSKKQTLRHYLPVFNLLRIAALVCLYAAGNYFVVREANHQMSGNSSSPSTDIPLAWLFWTITAALPLFYIYLGLKRKERYFLVTGLLLLAGTAFTVRYYHTLLAPEWAMVPGGLVLMGVAYGCSHYLKFPRAGLTAARPGRDPFEGLAQIEALLIDETLSPASVAAPHVVFGGGSGGGGGAGGQF